MRRRTAVPVLALAIALWICQTGCDPQAGKAQPRMTLFIGVDTSGSFRKSGYYESALDFLAYYIYGHLNGLGGLERPREMFVAPIGGNSLDEPKAFLPIHDFEGKEVGEISNDLREWLARDDTMTDFNSFFIQVERIVKERNLVLAPIDMLVVTDGIPDLSKKGAKAGSLAAYHEIDVSGLEYLSRRLTLRLAFTSPKAGENWRRQVPRQRVRLWAVDGEVMEGWGEQLEPSLNPAAQDGLWKWINDNVDYRVR